MFNLLDMIKAWFTQPTLSDQFLSILEQDEKDQQE